MSAILPEKGSGVGLKHGDPIFGGAEKPNKVVLVLRREPSRQTEKRRT